VQNLPLAGRIIGYLSRTQRRLTKNFEILDYWSWLHLK